MFKTDGAIFDETEANAMTKHEVGAYAGRLVARCVLFGREKELAHD
jgi:hypothetical protein